MSNGLSNALATPMGGIITLAIIVFLATLAVLWFLLPFAIFGTKAKLDDLKAEMKTMNENLQAILAEMRQRRAADDKEVDQLHPKITATRD